MSVNIHCLTLGLLLTAGPCTTDPPAPGRGVSGAEKPLLPGTVAEARTDESPKPLTQQTKTDDKYMAEHSGEAWGTRKAIISGHLKDAAPMASRIADDAWTPHLRPEYREHVTRVRAAARSVEGAATLELAAGALGELGAACAGCHREFGGPRAPAAAAPTPGEPMLAHAAAELALWHGLTYPSDESWLRGASALLEAPELDSDVEQVSALARRTRELARDALTAKEPRAALYARVVSTCATCHTSVGVELP